MADILMNKEQIMEIIPHRDPFLLIDEIVEMEVGVKVKARKYIKEGKAFPSLRPASGLTLPFLLWLRRKTR